MFDRHGFDVRLKVYVSRAGLVQAVSGRTNDLSFGGLGATLTENLPAGTLALVAFRLPAMQFEVLLPATVQHTHHSRCGLRFADLNGEQKALVHGIWHALRGRR
ncbi:MAG TPA: PilZ domain-containing protein [Clostridia bacterium]|nr:PilZ domain-containing protein [Clostridia bacterium]